MMIYIYIYIFSNRLVIYLEIGHLLKIVHHVTCGVVEYDIRCIWLFPGRGLNFVSLELKTGTAVSCN